MTERQSSGIKKVVRLTPPLTGDIDYKKHPFLEALQGALIALLNLPNIYPDPDSDHPEKHTDTADSGK